MNTNYQLIGSLISLVEKYEEENQPKKLELMDFVLWLTFNLSNNLSVPKNSEPNYSEADDFIEKRNENKVKIGRLMNAMYKYAKNYSKKVLENSLLKSMDEFGILANLMVNKKITKGELINSQLISITTGTEILKRLLRLNLIIEIESEKDRRSKIVQITDKGKAVILQLFNEMGKVSLLVNGNLNEFEQHILAHLLDKLDVFHRDIYHNCKTNDINEIIENYITKNEF